MNLYILFNPIVDKKIMWYIGRHHFDFNKQRNISSLKKKK